MSDTPKRVDVSVVTAPYNIPMPISQLIEVSGVAGPPGPPGPQGPSGTVPDPLILSGDATDPLGAVTLQQVQALIAAALP